MFYNTGIKAIVLPDTIEEIGVGTFVHAVNLIVFTSVQISRK